MPEAVTGTGAPTKATAVIIHFNSIKLFIIYVLEQWPQGKLKDKTAQDQKQNTQDFRNERKHIGVTKNHK